MRYPLSIFTYLILVCSCVPLDQSTNSNSDTREVLSFDSRVYENDIKTVLLHPFLGNIEDEIKPAAISIDQDIPLLLSFDQLTTDYDDFKVKIIHCNFDWQKSLLSENEYLFTFNEFPIRDYEFSFNTRTAYTHYTFSVPKVKLPGNYLLVVYRGNNTNDLVLSERFIVFGQAVGIAPEVTVSTDIAKRNMNQQVSFLINYSKIEILNPLEDIKVVIRQNERWDNAIFTLKPTFVDDTRHILEYQHFNLENNFLGGNEFRFFDLRTINYSGQNVSGIKKAPTRLDAFLSKDKDRGAEVYGLFNDINGDFVINNLESSPPSISSDYVNVHFFLETEKKLPQDVYIGGELANWNFTNKNRMSYDEELGGYTGTLFLKQGWYNYIYYVLENEVNPYILEGSHFETENQYEFIVYFRPPGSRADQIVGYFKFNFNERRNLRD